LLGAIDLSKVLDEKAGIVTQEALVSYVNDEFKRRQTERLPYELQWQLNINFIENNQYVDINPVALKLEEIPKLYEWQEREVFNQIAPVVETRIARLSRMRPILKSRPATTSPRDIRASKVSSHLLRNIYYEEGVRSLMDEIYGWLESTGTCFMKNVWNPQKGKVIGRSIVIIKKEDGTEEQQEIDIHEGGLEPIVVPPQEIFPDSAFRQEVDDCRSLIHARAIHVDEVEETWGVKVSPEQTTSVRLQRASIGIGGLGYGFGYNYVSTQLKDHVVVKEYWEAPSKKFPEGRLIIVANGKLLFAGVLPYPVGKEGTPIIPFEKVVSIQRPGVFWGRCVVDRLIPVQRRYNALRNRKAEYLNRCAIGQYWVQDGSTDLDILQENIGEPGFIGVYAKGFEPPQPAVNPQLPVAFDTEEATLLQEINVLSGVSDISKQSRAPAGVKSGVALSIALEQDDTRLSKTAANVEDFLIRCGRQWLRFHKHFVSGVRTLQAVGEDNVIDIIYWTGSDITSDDVIIEPFSAIAESPAQRRQMVFDLLASGLFHNEQGVIDNSMKAKIFEMIEMGNWEHADDESQLQIAKAERENAAMSQGQLQPVNTYDDNVIHVKRHNQYRLTVEYEELVKQFPMIDMIFQQHVDQHLMALIPPMAPQPQPVPGVMPSAGGNKPMALPTRALS
jgi:hypothetical protein